MFANAPSVLQKNFQSCTSCTLCILAYVVQFICASLDSLHYGHSAVAANKFTFLWEINRFKYATKMNIKISI